MTHHPSLNILLRAVESSLTGVVISDCNQPDMPLIYVNPSFTELTGYSLDECVGKNCRFLQGPETDQEEVDKIRAAIKYGNNCTVTILNYRKDGTTFWNELRISPVFDDNGQLTHFIGIQNDITEIVSARKAMIEAKESAENMTRLKTEFLNVISHELRTPLTVMLGNLPLLTDPEDMPDAEEVAEIAVDIEESGHHLLTLINELLDISRIEEGKLKVNPKPVAAQKNVENSVANVIAMANRKNLQLTQEIEEMTVFADPIRLKQIFINLLGNAIKFTDAGSIAVKGYRNETGDMAIFEVHDTGIGIREKFLPYIFDVFRQVDGSSTRETSGSGLGLAITQKLVKLMGGEISVESTFGKGSVFTFSIPLIK